MDIAIEPRDGWHPDREPAVAGCQPSDELMGEAGRIGTHQKPAFHQFGIVTGRIPVTPSRRQCGDRVINHSQVVIGFVRPGGRPAGGSPAGLQNANIGWNPNPPSRCSVAPSLCSEWTSNRDASTSLVTGPPLSSRSERREVTAARASRSRTSVD